VAKLHRWQDAGAVVD
jgi:hypothetical protein